MPSPIIRQDQTTDTLTREGSASDLDEQLARQQTKQRLATQINCHDRNTAQQRIAESEAGSSLTDEEYEHSMDEFFIKELGLVR